MMGQPNFHLYAGNLLEYLKRTAWEPDFGFLLGQHWQTLTLVQRNSFNSLMRNIVIKEYIPGKADDVTRNCEMNVTAFEKQSSNTRTHGPLPWPRPMQASAKTSLGEGKGGLSYIYESNPDGRWELLNLVITQARPLAWQPSLRELYARTLTGIIMREGFEGLKKHLTEQLVGSAPHDGTVTKD